MANQNFVVHNGLTVGALTIDAATSNVSLPVGKQILIGNVIMRDNGDGKVSFRDATDNNDAIIVATVSAPSVTQGNIQIGTNHIESVNANGPISIRPNNNGSIGLFANTITMGKGTGQVLITTGAVLDPIYGVNYPGANILIQTGNTLTGTGNVTIAMPTASSSTTTGALQVVGGVGIGGAAFIGGNLTVKGNLFVDGNVTTFNTNNLSINDSLIYLADDNPADILDIGFVSSFTSPVRYQHTGLARDASDGVWKLFANIVAEPTTTIDFTYASYSDLKVGNITPGLSNLHSLGSTTLWWQSIWGVAVNAQYADLAENYQADAVYEPGTVVHFGGDFEVSQCDADMCTKVAGVVSTNPAYLMNAVQQGEFIVPVALTGRVPTKVTGSVQKGDMMVSAGNGRARAEANPRIGSVIGKALENSEGDAVIEVVVGKH